MISANTPEKPSRAGFILAGGRSSRMGTDKAFLELGGRTLLDRTLALVRSVAFDVAIVGEAEKYSSYAAVVEDLYKGAGPLAGIHAALAHSSAELNLMLAVDMPFVSAELLGFLFATAEKTSALVTVPRTSRGFQPLCAVYRRPFAAAAEQALKAGKNKIDALFPGLPVRIVEERELTAAGFSERIFRNVNTSEDYSEAQAEARRSNPA